MSHSSRSIDPVEALHAALLQSDIKLDGAARIIGRAPGTLYNKFSDSMPGNEVSAREALALAKAAKTDAYVDAVCAYFGGVFLRVPDGVAADDDVLEAYLDIIKSMGELSSDFMLARADGVVDPSEFEGLRQRAFKTMAALHKMLAELETTVKEVPAVLPIPIRGSSVR